MRLLILTLALLSAPVWAKVYKTEEKSMSYSECINRLTSMSKIVPTKLIVQSDIVTTVRFKTDNGSLLATCSKPDQKMTLSYTDNPF